MTTQERTAPVGLFGVPSSTLLLQRETIFFFSRTGKLGVDEGQCCARENRQNEMFRGVLLHARAPGISVLVCVAFVPDAGHIFCSQASEKKHLPLHEQ